MKNIKKRLCVFLSFFMFVNIFFNYDFVFIASTYTDSIQAFNYNGYYIPAYDGDLYEVINNNEPKFTKSQLNQNIYESYSKLDRLGRVGVCIANIDKTLMPTGERGSISSVTPTGWVQKKYDFVSGKYLYNRSHLIGWQLTGENANKNNLMTGTKSFNVSGMLPFENLVADYIKQDEEYNVLYRITPVFQGNNLLASGVIMEAESVDDLGESIKFCVFVYNVQNGVSIDYSTGDSIVSGTSAKTSIQNATVSVSNCTYNGKSQKPKVVVNLNSKTLNENVDYKVSYTNNVNAGTANITIEGINKYSGKIAKHFTIYKAKYTPSISSKTYTYDSKSHSISISGVKSGSTVVYKTFKSGKYSSKKPSRKSVGKTTVYYNISNPNYYAISGSKTITILPKNTSGFSLTRTKKGFKINWKKQSLQTTGYNIRYSTNSNMSKSKSITVSNNKTISKTISGLKKNKKYYVQIRTYKKTGNGTYYSKWSSKKSIVVKY